MKTPAREPVHLTERWTRLGMVAILLIGLALALYGLAAAIPDALGGSGHAGFNAFLWLRSVGIVIVWWALGFRPRRQLAIAALAYAAVFAAAAVMLHGVVDSGQIAREAATGLGLLMMAAVISRRLGGKPPRT